MTMNRFWKLNKYPEGNDFASALSLETAPVGTPEDGEVLIKNEYLSLDAGTRMWMTPRTDSYQPPLPLGSPMMGLGLGRVIASRDSRFKEGILSAASASGPTTPLSGRKPLTCGSWTKAFPIPGSISAWLA